MSMDNLDPCPIKIKDRLIFRWTFYCELSIVICMNSIFLQEESW